MVNDENKYIIAILQNQRNQANDVIVELFVKINMMQEEIKVLKEESAEKSLDTSS